MRIAVLVVSIVSACGPVAPAAKHPEAPPPRPAYEVVRSANLQLVWADETDVYWTDGGIHRMAHGPGHTAERIYASDAYIYELAIARDDVYFLDDANVLRALPRKQAGAPTEIHTFEGQVWGVVADGDGVWVGVDDRLERWSREPAERQVELPRVGTHLAIADGVAYVTGYDQPTLVAADLASGKTTKLSEEWYFGDAQGLAVSGKSVLAAYSEGVAALPRAGGKPTLVFPAATVNLAADAAGYVALGYSALVEHRSGHAPRVLAASHSGDYVGGGRGLAIGGGYVYHVDTDDVGNYLLEGTPRDSGPTMMRLPLGTYVSALTASGPDLFAAIEDPSGLHLARIGVRRTTNLSDSAGYLESLAAGEGVLAFYQDGMLGTVDLASKRRVDYPNELAGGTALTVHKGRIYSAMYGQIYSTKIGTPGSTRQVADGTVISGTGEVQIGSIHFARDHLYFTIPWAGVQGLGRVDEEGHVEMQWTYREAGNATLQPDFAIIGDVAYLHDEYAIYAVPLDGGDGRTLAHHDAVQVLALQAVGNHLVARLLTPRGDTLVEISRRTGKVRVVWSGYSDGGYSSYYAFGDDAIYLYSPELSSVLKLDL